MERLKKLSTTALGRAVRLAAIGLLAMVLGAGAALAQLRAYVTNNGDNTLSVIDVATNTTVGTIPVAGGPSPVIINAAGSRAYVGLDIGEVAVVDLATSSVIATAPVETSPAFLTFSGNQAFLYVSNNGGTGVTVIDTATNTAVTTVPTGPGPSAIATTPDGASVWVGNFDGTIAVIDTATNTVTSTFTATPSSLPHGIVFTPDGVFAYVANRDTNDCVVVDTATKTVVATIPTGNGPFTNVITPGGTTVYQTNINSNSVSVIDTATNTVIATVPVGSRPIGSAITPDGAFVYVANLGSDSVSVINTATNTVVATVPVGSVPFDVAIASASQVPPPNCSNAVASPNLLWPANHKFVPITISGIVNPVPGAVTITVTSIFQNEPTSGAPDATGVGTGNPSVRAERDGGGDGRVYHINFTATGASGSCTGSVTVGVPHDQGRHGGPVDQGPLYNSTLP